MTNVHPISSSVNRTIDDVVTWQEGKTTRGEFPGTTSRLRITALKRLTSILADDEPKDARSVLANLDSITRRWATLNSDMKSDTATTYQSRAQGLLEDFFRFHEDPTKFQFNNKRREATDDEKPRAKKQAAESKTTTTQAPPIPPPAPVGDLRIFPLGGGREFKFALPSDLVLKDVKKIALHLATYAEDFDPDQPANTQVGLAVRSD